MSMPWEGVIPPDDQAAFRRAEEEPPAGEFEAGDHPAMIIVDMTREFVDSSYLLGYSQTGYPAVTANRAVLTAARKAGIPVFFTASHPMPAAPRKAAETGMWKRRGTPWKAAGELPPGDVIVEELTPLEDEIVIYKHNKPSAFFGTPLASLLTYYKVDTTIVTGMVTSGCVRATVIDAFQYNFRVVIPHECCADRSQISHKVSLFDIHMKYADVVESKKVIDYLKKVAA